MTEPKRINLFGLSGGKDSTALWGWAFNDSGYPVDSIVGTFCDTENEYDGVYLQVAILDVYGRLHGARPIETIGSMGFLDLCIQKKRFPSPKARFCTQKLKIEPTHEFVNALLAQGYEVVSHSGVRRSESTERALLEEYGESGIPGVKVRRPLLDFTISDVWASHKRYGLPINPIYFTGRKRVGCKLCCMSNKQDIRITAKNHPEVIDEYRRWEEKVGSIRDGGVASFFKANTVPESLRSKDYFSKRQGKSFKIGTIDDVVNWSKTLRGGKQCGFDFMFDDDPIYELDDAHEPCKSGYCE